MMRNWLKWLVAGKELAELERWRVSYQQHRQWLASFHDVAQVLDRMKGEADGLATSNIYIFRDLLKDDARRISAIERPWLDMLAERQRQIEVHGFTPEHDNEQHTCSELEMAAVCYAANAAGYIWAGGWPGETVWPWEREWWKPSTPRRDLVKAGALIMAAIELRDRMATKQAKA